MRHVDRRRLQTLVKGLDLRSHHDAKLRVEVRKRLVIQKDLRVADKGATHGNALALAAGQLAWRPLQIGSEVQNLCSFVDAPVDLFLALVAQLQAEAHVVEHGHVRIKRVVLEDHRNIAVPWGNVVDHLACRWRSRPWKWSRDQRSF